MTRSINPREGRTWPAYMLGGRLRTTTAALVIAFCAIWWLYETYEPVPAPPHQVPASEVVPPGFIPDPDYTWAPRSDVQQPSASETTSTAPTSATPTTSAAPTTSATPTETPVPGRTNTAPATPERETPAAMPPVLGAEAATAPAAPAAPAR